MQPYCLFGRTSSDGGGGGRGGGIGLLFLSPAARKPLSFSWIGLGPRPVGGAGAVAALNGCGDQDHYAVLGIRRTATASEIKRAYRMLAREHHPDVSRDRQAGEVFKRIRLAYEVLSDEVKRERYDLKWTFYPNYDKRIYKWEEFDKRIYKWEELRRQMRNRRQKSKSYQTEEYGDATSYERGPFGEVLRFAFFVLFFMQTVGCRASLTLCGISALLDKQLDAGYKTGYLIAWLLGGRAGVLLTLCLYFASWLCGKRSSSAVALVVVAMWVGAYITRFAPLPQGAVLTLLYMSIKLQFDSK